MRWLPVLLLLIAGEDPVARQAARIEEGKAGAFQLLAEAEEQVRREPKNPAGYTLAATAWSRDESRRWFTKALELDPEYAPAHLALARYLRHSDLRNAWIHFQKAAELLPNDLQVRREAVAAAARAGFTGAARQLAGDDPELRVEVIHGCLDANRADAAEKVLAEYGLTESKAGNVLVARGRLLQAKGQRDAGLELLLEGWRADPRLLIHYRFAYPRESLVRLLSRARRDQDLQAVAVKGVEIYPREYPLYEYVWKALFAEVKADYSAEYAAVRRQIAALLKNHPPSGELLKAAALGYDMVQDPERAGQMRARLLAEFPHSNAALMARRAKAVQTKDLQAKLALLEEYNRFTPVFPMYQEVMNTLEAMNATPEQFLKGAGDYLRNTNFAQHAVWQVAESFTKRRIHLDLLEDWLKRVPRGGPEATGNAWSARLRSVEARLLTLRGRPAEAERILEPLLDLSLQGYSNVDKGKVRWYLAEALEAQGKREEALEQYVQAFAQSQHFLAEAGQKFRELYRALRGNNRGMDEYLADREGMYQVAESTGIERGTPLNLPVPEFRLPLLGGEVLTPASLRGKVTVLNLWATWCGPCIKELPHFEEFYRRTKDDPGVAVLAVSTDENKALVAPFVRKNQYTFPVAFDDGLKARLGVRGIPTTFIFDAQGTVRLRMVGFNQHEPLVPYLQKLVAQHRDPAAGEAAPSPKRLFQQVDRLPKGERSEADWKEAQKKSAEEALARLPEKLDGVDLYYAGGLALFAGRYPLAVQRFAGFLKLPATEDQEGRTARLNAQMKIREAFTRGNLVPEAERYYADDPIGLGVFYSGMGRHEQSQEAYRKALASSSPETVRRAKSLIVISLGSARQPEEMARRLEEWREDLTPNAVVNAYSTLARLHDQAGDRERSELYSNRVFAMGQEGKGGKAVDGPVVAHMDWMIGRLEAGGDPGKLNDFLHRMRTELANNKSVVDRLAQKEKFRSVLHQPAKELQADFFLNGQPTTLLALRGRVVLVDFFAHWCGPCIGSFPFVRDLQQRYQGRGLTVLGVTGLYKYYGVERQLTPEQESARMRDHFQKEYEVTWPMLLAAGDANNKNYGVGYIPHKVLIDRAGVIRHAWVGKGSEDEIAKSIEVLLAEK